MPSKHPDQLAIYIDNGEPDATYEVMGCLFAHKL